MSKTFSLILLLWVNGLIAQRAYVSAKLNGKYGLLNDKGEWQIEPTWDSVAPYQGGAWLYYSKGKWGAVSTTGKMISPAIWEDIGPESNGTMAIFDGHYWGFMDSTGKTIIKPQFLEVDVFQDELAAASKMEDLWGYIDKSGKWLIPNQFQLAWPYYKGRAKVLLNDTIWVIDKQGKRLFAEEYAYQRVLTTKGTIGIQRADGSWLLEPEYENVSLRYDLLYFVKREGKWGLMDTLGNLLFPNILEEYKFLGEGFVGIKKDGKWGAANKRGNLVFPYLFEDIKEYSEGLALAKYKQYWGVVNQKGEFVISPKFELLLEGYCKPTASSEQKRFLMEF